MSKIKLAVPTTKYKDKALQFKKEFYEKWLQSVINNADIKTVNP